MDRVPRKPARVIDSVPELGISLSMLEPRPPEVRVVMADPEHFDVLYVINPHMEGNVGSVDRAAARQQWEALKATYEGIGYEVAVVPPAPGLPDLVFMANQSFPGQLPDGRWAVVRAAMFAPQRQPEVEVVVNWYRGRGARIVDLDRPLPFEGMGDAAWIPGRRGIIGGYGFRTDPEVYEEISAIFDVPVLRVRLVDPRFYHVDTALQLVDDTTALYVPEAFDQAGRALLTAAFPRLVPIPLSEAAQGLSANGHCPDGRHFIVHKGSPRTVAAAQRLGLEVIEVDTSEFLKSGGSVYCMKLMLP
jgi:N-dimethylarginine dimethylaminohydrolase